jgi:hypothetical protein
MAVNIKATVFSDVTPWCLVDSFPFQEGHFYPEDITTIKMEAVRAPEGSAKLYYMIRHCGVTFQRAPAAQPQVSQIY